MNNAPAPRPDDMVILFDVDNTLLDNDRVRDLLGTVLSRELGALPASRFWDIYEEVREKTGIVDFPASIARFRAEQPDLPGVIRLEQLIFGFPFADVAYAHARAALAHARTFGRPVVMSDDDQCFQRHKIRAAGIEDAVDGNVLVFDHKELRLAEMMRYFPARHYVMIDDKPRILLSLKEQLGSRITTVMVCQGKYAHDPAHHAFAGADMTIEGIAEFLDLDAARLLAAAAPAHERTASHPGEISKPRGEVK